MKNALLLTSLLTATTATAHGDDTLDRYITAHDVDSTVYLWEAESITDTDLEQAEAIRAFDMEEDCYRVASHINLIGHNDNYYYCE